MAVPAIRLDDSVNEPVSVQDESWQHILGSRCLQHLSALLPFLIARGLGELLYVCHPVAGEGLGVVIGDLEGDRH